MQAQLEDMECHNVHASVLLTLVVKKKGVPDLTMVDLPGIARVPVHNQPEDIYEQILGIITECIKPEETIILNVLSAGVSFATCESVRMSRRVDGTGQRTLAVVTKCDQFPNGLLEKITANDINICVGYVCVRNRNNDETYDEARVQEATLFKTHPLLSKMDKSMVGIPVLANKLIVHIQSMIVTKCLPDIDKKINERLDASVLELNKLPRKLATVPDATAAFIQMVGSLIETLEKILIRGDFDAYANDKQMHCNARMVEMLDEFSKQLHSSVKFADNFLVEEMEVLKETNGIQSPHFISHSAFLCLLEKRVKIISELPINFINNVWGYLENTCIRVLVDNCGNYPQLLPSVRKAAHNVMTKMKGKFLKRVVEMIEIEKITEYTCDPNFNASWKKLMGDPHDQFAKVINECNHQSSGLINVEGYGCVNIKHLLNVSENIREQAFDLKMRMTAYWEIVLKRIVDWIALHLRFLIKRTVNKMRTEIVNEVMANDGGIKMMMDEPSSMASKRERLQKSIDLLQESKEAINRAIDGFLFTIG